MSKICIYKIPEAPYLAISSVYKEKKNNCVIEDVKGKKRKVEPIYVGPIDNSKLLQFGTLVSRYVQNLKYLQDSVGVRTVKLFS